MRTSHAALTGLLAVAVPVTAASAAIYGIPQDKAAGEARTLLSDSLKTVAPDAKIVTHDFVGGSFAVPSGLKLPSVPPKFTAAVVTCATTPCLVGFNRKIVLVRPGKDKTVGLEVKYLLVFPGQSRRVIFSVPAGMKKSVGRSTSAPAITTVRVRDLRGTLLGRQTSTIGLK